MKQTLRHCGRTLRSNTALTAALAVAAALLAGCGERPDDAVGTPDSPGRPEAVSSPASPAAVWFEEVAAERGLDFRHVAGRDGQKWLPQIMGGGAALVDADGGTATSTPTSFRAAASPLPRPSSRRTGSTAIAATAISQQRPNPGQRPRATAWGWRPATSTTTATSTST